MGGDGGTTGDDAVDAYNAEWRRLQELVRGRRPRDVEDLVRAWAARQSPYVEDVDVQLLARVLSDPRWGRKHPSLPLRSPGGTGGPER